MAETSGFFSAEEVDVGEYDREYFAKQFANYFSLFIKNGVFGSPTDQLKVVAGNNLSVIVKAGYAFIDGYWYENSSDKEIFLVPNYESQTRVDSIRVRMSEVSRDIKTEVFTGDTDLARGEDIYDLQLATVTVLPFSETITDAHIKDTRPDETVCGFVTQLLSVQTTKDLFAQYQEMFEEWFDDVKGALSGDVAGNLLERMDTLENEVSEKFEELGDNIGETLKPLVQKSINVGIKFFSFYHWDYGKSGQVETTFKVTPPQVKDIRVSGAFNNSFPVYLVEYMPSNMSSIGRMLTGMYARGGLKGTVSCMSTLVARSWTDHQSPPVTYPAGTEIETYVRNVDITPAYVGDVTITIYDNKKLEVDPQYPQVYNLTTVYTEGNVVSEILGVAYYGTYVDTIISV